MSRRRGPKDRRIILLQQLGLPYLVHGRSEGLDFPYSHMDIDNEGAFREAARLLVQLGHGRIALINGDDTQTFAIFRERGVRRALGGRRHRSGAVDDPVAGYDGGKRISRGARPA